ncbi:MBL fold metallo-hydrolase [Falsiroseomonas tokyonensis]|uniref:MBL fold metallo-hydrolase n=1 Tax=Falsiroseomonas tokyonensis TaxID=430521 RepID=A0ABV7C6V8_9PROT|nr:MBL fold metallo-hydrolase [Falsiroseomonas tokyonensis]MBU8541869.1 MBL fold metallo-hydrolase [Falsiroseomonas tokyonensis]
MTSRRPVVDGFYDEGTGSVAYIVADPGTARCAIIDPVLGFDRDSGATDTHLADQMADHVRARGLTVEWVLDTHPHADHLSAVAYLGDRLGAPTGIGERVAAVQGIWADIYHLPELQAEGRRYWDRLFAEGDRFRVGGLEVEVIFSPGHTAASVTYLVGDAAFIHDTLFMPDAGTARADFPGGDARALYRSIQRILALEPQTRLFTGHDYRPGGRAARWEATVAEQRARNVHLRDGVGEEEFVRLREERDRTLPLPGLMLAALQVNLRGGRLPEPEANGSSYLKLPLNRFGPAAPEPRLDPE